MFFDTEFFDAIWAAIQSLFAPSPPPTPAQPCPLQAVFEAQVIGVQFLSPVPVSRRGATVGASADPDAALHWKLGLNVHEPNVPNASMRPAVVLMRTRGESAMMLRIRVTRSECISSAGEISATLGALTLRSTGPCPTSVGVHDVPARIVDLPAGIAWDRGDATWSVQVAPIGTVALGTTRLEVVTVVNTPAFFYTQGVSIEVLRMLCGQSGVLGLSATRTIASTLSEFCHGPMQSMYDTVGGASHFNAMGLGASGFRLAAYISPPPAGRERVVNCYDQAAGLTALAGAVGVYLTWKFMEPFGYLATSDLVGVGICNNPFFTTNGTAPVVDVNAPNRTSFGRHAFTNFPSLINSDAGLPQSIGDACAGPARFTGDLRAYVDSAVDQTRTRADWMAFNNRTIQQWNQWEAHEITQINASGMPDSAKAAARATVHTTAQNNRAALQQRNQDALALDFASFVRDGFGLVSVAFNSAEYTGP
jgi:hypothetical protein